MFISSWPLISVIYALTIGQLHHVKCFIITDYQVTLISINYVSLLLIRSTYVNLLSDFYFVLCLSQPSCKTSASACLINHVISSKGTTRILCI